KAGRLGGEQLECPAATPGRVAKMPLRLSRSRARLKIRLCDLWKHLCVVGQIGFVAVQEFGQSRTRAIIASNALPLRVTGKRRKYLRNVLKQLLAFGW